MYLARAIVLLVLAAPIQARMLSPSHVAAFVKVWGYLKYFHPDVTQGRVNWDSAFTANIALAEDSATFPLAIEHLLISAGGPKTYGLAPTPHSGLQRLADLTWIDDSSMFTPKMREILHTIYSDSVPNETRYVGHFGAGNASFTREDSTELNPYPDEPHRLLALARYWNAIEYFYPYIDILPGWADTLLAYIPVIADARDAGDYQLGMLRLCCSIHDTHSSTSGLAMQYVLGSYYAPLPLTHIGKKLVFRNPRTVIDVPFKPGDGVQTIGGQSVGTIIEHWASLTPHSNDASMMRNIAREVTIRPNADSVEVIYDAADGQLHRAMIPPMRQADMRMMKPIDTAATAWSTIDGGIGYINMAKLTSQDVVKVMTLFANKHAIIFDLRNYPNWTVWGLAYQLRAMIPWARFRAPAPGCPGSYVIQRPEREEPDRGRGIFPGYAYRGRIIVMVNDDTQSQAEYTAMMLRSIPGSIIVGSQTSGADGNISSLPLPGGIQTYFSGLGVFYPDGTPTQRIGIAPDVVVEPTIAGLRAGRDEVLDKAIELAKQ